MVSCYLVESSDRCTGTSIGLHICALPAPEPPVDAGTNADTIMVDIRSILVYQPHGSFFSSWRQVSFEVEASQVAELRIGQSFLHFDQV